jgi:hypothetical protein
LENLKKLGRPGCLWEDNIKMDLREAVSEGNKLPCFVKDGIS